jgi:hypothetical protein
MGKDQCWSKKTQNAVMITGALGFVGLVTLIIVLATAKTEEERQMEFVEKMANGITKNMTKGVENEFGK